MFKTGHKNSLRRKKRSDTPSKVTANVCLSVAPPTGPLCKITYYQIILFFLVFKLFYCIYCLFVVSIYSFLCSVHFLLACPLFSYSQLQPLFSLAPVFIISHLHHTRSVCILVALVFAFYFVLFYF